MTDFYGFDKPKQEESYSSPETFVRDEAFGDILFTQWLPRTFYSSTTGEFRRITLGARKNDEMYYTADPANGVVWHLVFLPDGSAYPWKYIGGPPITKLFATEEVPTGTINTWVDFPTTGPSLTAPFAGTYEATCSCSIIPNAAAQYGFIGVALGAADGFISAGRDTNGASPSAFLRVESPRGALARQSVAAGQEFRARAFFNNSGVWRYVNRIVNLWPVRLG